MRGRGAEEVGGAEEAGEKVKRVKGKG